MTELSHIGHSQQSVLVVDDNHDYADSLCQWLEATTAWHARPVYSVREAVAALKEDAPDAMLLDLEMLPACGLQVLDTMTDMGEPLPVTFAVSGNEMLLEAAAADARIHGVALKPADPEVLARWLDETATRE